MKKETELKEEKLCERCKKNKATLTFTDGVLSYIHGFTERICQECYDKQMKESNWYKEGYKKAIQKTSEIIEELKVIEVLNVNVSPTNKQKLKLINKEELIQKLNQEKNENSKRN